MLLREEVLVVVGIRDFDLTDRAVKVASWHLFYHSYRF
jgi:hypothetical protein